jgi:cytochrome b
MKPYHVNLLNIFLLVVLSLWGFFGSATPSFTALIPIVFAIALLGLHNGLKNGKRTANVTAIFVTAVLVVALIKPLIGALGRVDPMSVFRVSTMMASSAAALYFFVSGKGTSAPK